MAISNTQTTQNFLARIAGFLYLAIIVFGMFSEVVVRSKLIASGKANTTVNNMVRGSDN